MENKVANKPIIPIDIESWLPAATELMEIDLKDFLFNGMIIKESDFRQKVDETQWEKFRNKYVCLHNSTKAIVPQWAFMILTAQLREVDAKVFYGRENFKTEILTNLIYQKNLEEYIGKRVVIKGCSKETIGIEPYLLLVEKLQPIARAINFGESCSMIPIYKK